MADIVGSRDNVRIVHDKRSLFSEAGFFFHEVFWWVRSGWDMVMFFSSFVVKWDLSVRKK